MSRQHRNFVPRTAQQPAQTPTSVPATPAVGSEDPSPSQAEGAVEPSVTVAETATPGQADQIASTAPVVVESPATPVAPAGAILTPYVPETPVPVTLAAIPAEPAPVVAAPSIDDVTARITRRLQAMLTGEGDPAFAQRNYTTLMGGRHLTKAALAEGITLLKRVIDQMLESGQPAAFDVFWGFMVQEKNGLMHEHAALRGVHLLDQKSHDRVSLVYHLFREHVTRSRADRKLMESGKTINQMQVVTLLGNDLLLGYLNSKRG